MKVNLGCALLFVVLAADSAAQDQHRERVRPAREGIAVGNEVELKHEIELKHTETVHACEARLELEYYQKGTEVHVESTLTNEICAASSGSYVIQVRYRDENGNDLSKEFDENWQRDDDQPIVVAKDYFVADNVDVLRVRSRKLRCKCAAQPAE